MLPAGCHVGSNFGAPAPLLRAPAAAAFRARAPLLSLPSLRWVLAEAALDQQQLRCPRMPKRHPVLSCLILEGPVEELTLQVRRAWLGARCRCSLGWAWVIGHDPLQCRMNKVIAFLWAWAWHAPDAGGSCLHWAVTFWAHARTSPRQIMRNAQRVTARLLSIFPHQ